MNPRSSRLALVSGFVLLARKTISAPNGTNAIFQIVRFARRNIQFYDGRAIELYELICSQYLIGRKSAEARDKARSKFR